jgi:hypothetical protein
MTSAAARSPSRPLRVGQSCHQFRITRITPLPALRSTAVEAVHPRTGLRLLHLHNDDSENLFAVAFRTPPPDDTGVPHILEHAVLGGSRKYPVKDPFLELLKRSMATFLNAMTYSDKTVYPVASNVRKDYFNLVDVYLDAVFHPLISPLTLKQEGHHLELADPHDPASPLRIRGIVYNEMKGAYSELDSLIERHTHQGLFPDTAYGRDSGGDPEAIPGLTYEAFTGFCRRLYHPANAFVLLYGNIPTRDHLAFLAGPCRDLPAAQPVDSALTRQPRWSSPREAEEPYPIGPDEDPAGKAAVTVSWLVGDAADPILDLGLDVLDRLLLGHSGAPLYRALIDSRLGEDLAPSGYSSGTLETSFHVGLKGTEPARKQAIVELIFDTLRACARDGFPAERIEAAFQRLEYAHREITAQYPLRLMNRVYESWLYDLDPLSGLRLAEHLDELRARWRRDPAFFSRLLEERLLRNPHRLTVLFRPDPALQARRDDAFAADMARRKAALSAAELRQVADEAADLERRQNAPNSPEALATLPALHRSDLPPEPRRIPGDGVIIGPGTLFLRNDVFANGVNHLVHAFDLRGLPAEDWDYLPLFVDFFTRLGTAQCPFDRMAERIAACTGGFGANLLLNVDARAPERLRPSLGISLKTLDRTHADALAIVRELLLELDLGDTRRLRDLVLQNKVRCRSGIIDAGHHFAALQAASRLAPIAALQARLDGLHQARLAILLARDFDARLAVLQQRLDRIRRFLLNPRRFALSFTGTPACCEATQAWVAGLADELPAHPLPAEAEPPVPLRAGAAAEGLAFPADVAFCAACMPAPVCTRPDAPATAVFCHLLSLGHLWEEIRVKGGAYGGFARYDPAAGLFHMMSYRDPEIARTLDVFARVRERLDTLDFSADAIERAIITCAKGEEQPIRPGAATLQTLLWRLTGMDDSLRRERYQALVQVEPAAVRQAAEALLAAPAEQIALCVLSSRQRLEAANRGRSQPLVIEDIFPDAEDAATADTGDDTGAGGAD